MSSDRRRVVAGVSLVGGGAIAILGVITPEALSPGYRTSGQTISALGGPGASAGSRAVFDLSFIFTGLLVLVAASGLHRAFERRLLTAVVAAVGFGITGVGGFPTQGAGMLPAQTDPLHFVAALLAFVGVGASALVVGDSVRGPFRYVSTALGALVLLVLVAFMALMGATPLGIGGLERWVAYVGLVWVVAYGGFLLAAPAARE